MTTSSLRTPLGRVRGFGAAHSGTSHFIAQRVTAVLLLFLVPYLAIDAALTLDPSYEGARAWIAQPWIAASLFVALFAALYHMRIGMQVIIEDYLHKPAGKLVLMVLNTFIVLALAAAGGFAILKLSLGV